MYLIFYRKREKRGGGGNEKRKKTVPTAFLWRWLSGVGLTSTWSVSFRWKEMPFRSDSKLQNGKRCCSPKKEKKVSHQSKWILSEIYFSPFLLFFFVLDYLPQIQIALNSCEACQPFAFVPLSLSFVFKYTLLNMVSWSHSFIAGIDGWCKRFFAPEKQI